MARLQVPSSYVKPLLMVASMSERRWNDLLKAIETTPVGMGATGFWGHLTKSVPALKPTEEFADAIFGFGQLTAIYTDDPKDMGADVANAVEVAIGKPIDRPSKKEALIERVNLIVARAGNIIASDKAYRLWLAHGKVANSMRIITDMRPLFQDKVDTEFKYAMVYHNFQIDYNEGANRRRTFFAIDSKDLKLLHEMVERAMKKEEAIKKGCSSSVEFIDLTSYGD